MLAALVAVDLRKDSWPGAIDVEVCLCVEWIVHQRKVEYEGCSGVCGQDQPSEEGDDREPSASVHLAGQVRHSPQCNGFRHGQHGHRSSDGEDEEQVVGRDTVSRLVHANSSRSGSLPPATPLLGRLDTPSVSFLPGARETISRSQREYNEGSTIRLCTRFHNVEGGPCHELLPPTRRSARLPSQCSMCCYRIRGAA